MAKNDDRIARHIKKPALNQQGLPHADIQAGLHIYNIEDSVFLNAD